MNYSELYICWASSKNVQERCLEMKRADRFRARERKGGRERISEKKMITWKQTTSTIGKKTLLLQKQG